MPIQINQIFNSRQEIADLLGGGIYSGIETPQGEDYIMLFLSQNDDHGYHDGWISQNLLSYTGAGQGDMSFSGNAIDAKNRAIRDHEQDGKSIKVFEKKPHDNDRGYLYEFKGHFRFVSYTWTPLRNNEGNMRQAIQFQLERVGDEAQQKEIPQNQNAAQVYDTMKLRFVNTRLGQGMFRNTLLEKFNHSCVVTGLQHPELLVASHIKPWAICTNEERLDPDNGLILSPSYDALFDRFLISFNEEGELMCSPSLTVDHLNALGVTQEARLQCEITAEMERYLSFHRSHLRS